jgi:maltose phosphorylase
MAGTWMVLWKVWWNACEKTTLLIFSKIPKQWTSYSFKINFRNQIITVAITISKLLFSGRNYLTIVVNGESVTVSPNNQVAVTQN